MLLMVDEAHSFGIVGKTGRGVCEEAGMPVDSIDVYMGTLSKTLASSGGYIAGDRGLDRIYALSLPRA
jgi:7-keto-8-aminopelargonate synthetase-like enzyme